MNVYLIGVTNESVVTASHAIFVEKGGYKAPAAVVGLQYRNSAFRETFFNITSGVIESASQEMSKQHSDMPFFLSIVYRWSSVSTNVQLWRLVLLRCR